MLAGGQIRVAGASSQADVTVLAVTGGTGAYRNVRGQLTIETIDDTTSKDTLELSGRGRMGSSPAPAASPPPLAGIVV